MIMADRNPFGQPTTPELLNTAEKSGFWSATPELAYIAAEAGVSDVSPWGLLGVLMAHQVSHIPPTVVLVTKTGNEGRTLAAGMSLNYLGALVGGSGLFGNKSTTFKLGLDLIQPFRTPVTDGTGEGLVKYFASAVVETKDEDGKPLPFPRKYMRYDEHCCVVHATEIDTLNVEMSKDATKLPSFLRGLWTGDTVGMLNSDKDRRANLPGNMARLAAMWGVQPTHALALLEDYHGGTPQRFLWLPAMEDRNPYPKRKAGKPVPFTLPEAAHVNDLKMGHPEIIERGTGSVEYNAPNPDDPSKTVRIAKPRPPVLWDLPREMESHDILPTAHWVHWSPAMRRDIPRLRAEMKLPCGRYEERTPEMEALELELEVRSHFLLMRIKVAVWLAFLHGRSEPTDLDWHLSEVVMLVNLGEMAGVFERCKRQAQKEAEAAGRRRGVESYTAEQTRDGIKWSKVNAARGRVLRQVIRAHEAGRPGVTARDISQGTKMSTAAVTEHLESLATLRLVVPVLIRERNPFVDGIPSDGGDVVPLPDRYSSNPKLAATDPSYGFAPSQDVIAANRAAVDAGAANATHEGIAWNTIPASSAAAPAVSA